MNKLFTVLKQGDKTFVLFLVIIFTAAVIILQILLYLKGFYSISADESGRTLLAFHWLYGTEPRGEPWLPLHKIITALALIINPDLFWTPRIAGTFFAILSVIAFIFYTHELFQDKRITSLAAVIALFFPPYVVIRAVPLAESMFLFFIISGSLFFLKWLRSDRSSHLMVSSVMFAFSSVTRYEGWIFCFCLFVYLLFKYKEGWKTTALNSFILAAFPLYWVIANFIDYGDPFYFIRSTSEGYKLSHNTFLMLLKYNLVTQFVYQNILYLNAGAFISLIFFSLINKEIRFLILFLVSVFVIMALLSFAEVGMPSHAFWRIPLPWSILLIPFTAHFIIILSEFLSEQFRKKNNFFIPGISSVIIVYFIFQVNRLSSQSMFTADEKNTGEYIAENCHEGKGNKVLIDSSGWEYLNIIVASNQPYLFIPTNVGGNPSLPVKSIFDQNNNLNTSELKEQEIKCLVIQRDEYKNYLDNSDQVRLKKNFGKWKIFSLQ